MPAADLVVADTSPVLNLALIDRVEYLRDQFPAITLPEQVWDELSVGDAGLDELQSARSEGFLDVVPVDEGSLFTELRRDLDVGESAAIAYAVRNDADLLLVDEREGRTAARRQGLDVTGAIGVLLRATEGREALKSELDALREAGFWISDDLYQTVLERAESASI